MKKIFLTLWSLVLAVSVSAQDVPNLIPPSPEAASIVGYGNTGMNFYTGSPSLSIPIYTATSRGVSIPVSLSYSGFGGHKVEAVAPWVGLGWSLNAGGVVSRTIRGLADDGPNGYQTMAALPNLDNSTIQTYQDYADGDYDGEPDEYNFNVNGMSGTFYINKSKQVVLRTKTDVRVTPVFASPSSKVVTHFEVTGTDGTTYVFAEQEKSRSYGLLADPNTIDYRTSSWYLSEVKDQNGMSLITLEYYDWSGASALKNIIYNAQSELDLGVWFGPEHMQRSWNTVEAKRIKQINYDHGKILFNKSSDKRLDYLNDYWLDNIEIKDKSDNLIKKFTLGYSYFTASGTATINSTPATVYFGTPGVNTGQYEWRLRLDAITEWDKTAAVSNPPHTFTYNTTHYLPSRYSFAQDHWGYYNGQTSNTSPESFRQVKYYDGWSNPVVIALGTANREPSEVHAQAGLLTKVTYPTGGHTSFTFGGHHAVEEDLKNDYVAQTIDFDPDGNWSPTDVNVALVNDYYEGIVIKTNVNHTCDIQVNFYPSNNTSQIADGVTMEYIGGPVLYSHGTDGVTLNPGTYKVKATIFDPNQTGCAFQATDNVRLEWDNEVLKTNKDVGGLRIEAIEDHDGIDADNDIRREFYYNEAGDDGASNSTGRVVNVPVYGDQVLLNSATTAPIINLEPNGYRRTIQSNYPLMKTNGSEVGYGKVTVRTIGAQNNGKTEYYFTTSSDYQDLYDGYYYTPLSGEAYYSVSGGTGTSESYPYPRIDSKDNLRGLLTKQIDYRWKGGNYYKTKVVENTYAGTFESPLNNGSPLLQQIPSFIENRVSANANYESIEGAIWKPGVHNHFKRYRLYSSRVDLQKTVTKSYDLLDDTGTLYTETETTNFWDDLADDHYQISRTQTQDSEGNTYETKMLYPYNTIPGLDAGAQAVLNNMVARNMIGSPVQQEQYKGTTKLSTTRTIFSSHAGTTTGQYYLPGQVQTAKGSNPLETRVRYHIYDNKGNPFELSQEDGTHIIYLWGYNQTFPVAQIQNATYTDILTLPAFGGSVDLGAGTLSAAQEAALRGMKGVLVTTMTYDVTVGMTSQTSPNGLTTYYEYDSFNRLKYVKDKDGNILRKMDYAYKVNANTTNN